MFRNKILPSIVFFIIGISLFWFVYRDFNFIELSNSLKYIKFKWIIVSIGFGLLSQLVRALRWKMLIDTMGYKPKTVNLFISVIVLYFTNLIIPRGGELSRCTVISKYDKVPFVKLIGTVFIERIVDLFAFLLILLIVFIWQFQFFETVMNYPEFKFDFSSYHIKLLHGLILFIITIILIYILVKFRIINKIVLKIRHFKNEFTEGIMVILHLKKRVKFILYTFAIFFLWLLGLYVIFFAYPSTDKLPFVVAILTYTFGTLAYLLPIQAGIGTWHFIVINCLFFYSIDKESGMIFALIAHTFTNLIFLIFGPIVLALLPLINNTNSQKLKPLSIG
jgi:glycosyltransferase 2 family protein